MAVSNGHIFYVKDFPELFSITKQPGDKITLGVDFSNTLASGDTVASQSALTISPTDVTNAVTSSALSRDAANKVVILTIDAGTTAWNTTGIGRLKFVATFTSGDKREIDVEVRVIDL